MAEAAQEHKELKRLGYELFIGALSVLSIFNMILLYRYRDDPALQTVVGVMNYFMMPIFIADFVFRFYTAGSRRDYLIRQFGWADLLSSLPLPNAKILRLFRLWRLVRLWREFGSNLIHQFMEARAENALLTVVFLVICVLEFGSLAVLRFEESAPNGNITNASDAIWWTYVTITTVGYGDRFPTTNGGRIVGLLVMTAGVGLFGTLSGYLANTFLSPKKKPPQPPADEPTDPRSRLADLRRQVEAQEEALATLKASIQGLEDSL
jgi:voltage-gated potassium channel